MNQLTEMLVTIGTAIIGVAILSVLVSRNSNTSGVLSSAGNAFATALGAATAPVTGASGFSHFPTGNMGGFGGLSLPNF